MAEAALPKLIPYKKTPVFNETTIPKGLLKAHSTKAGTWGKIVVLEGTLLYRILEPEVSEQLLKPGSLGFAKPKQLHEVRPEGKVSFYVEFCRPPESEASE